MSPQVAESPKVAVPLTDEPIIGDEVTHETHDAVPPPTPLTAAPEGGAEEKQEVL